MNNFFILFQSLLFHDPLVRKALGILPKPPKPPLMPWGKPAQTGVMGFFLDRWEYIKLAWVNYKKEADKNRRLYSKIEQDDLGGKVKYETKPRGKADKLARGAKKVEKL
jgi:hypothetical protein